jgi:transposase
MAGLAKPRLRMVDRSEAVPEISIDDLLPPDHPARDIWEYVQALDLSKVLDAIRAVEGVCGRNATDPHLLLSLWMYATCDGVGSARALDRLVHEHSAYRWLAGGVSINYHLLSDFRSCQGELLDGLLKAHVAALLHQGLVDLKCVAQDGLRVRASAGAGSFRRAATIEECAQAVAEQLEALRRQDGEDANAPTRRQRASRERQARARLARLAQAQVVAAELTAKQAERARQHPKEAKAKGTDGKLGRGSTTDPEARRMKMPDGGYRPGYNVQGATTVGTGIVVAVDVTNQGSDGGLLGPMLERIEAAHGAAPAEALVDGGYASKEDVEAAHARGTTVYAPLKQAAADLQKGRDPHAPKRGDQAGMTALRARMGTADGKAKYKLRAQTAEWTNAGMRQRGLYQVRVRGLAKVRAVVLLQALVHNLLQTVRLWAARGLRPAWRTTLRPAI